MQHKQRFHTQWANFRKCAEEVFKNNNLPDKHTLAFAILPQCLVRFVCDGINVWWQLADVAIGVLFDLVISIQAVDCLVRVDGREDAANVCLEGWRERV